jgi:histidine ammonia-lyase
VTLEIGKAGPTLEDVERVARDNEKVALISEAVDRIRTCGAMLDEKVEAGEIMYGINTGIGELSGLMLSQYTAGMRIDLSSPTTTPWLRR